MGGVSSKCSVIGYHYGAGIHFVPCKEADKLLKIKVDDKVIFEGDIDIPKTSFYTLSINNPNAFGGESKEGGVVGDIDIGGPGELPVNTYLASHQNPCPAYKHVLNIILKRVKLQALNPFLKKWKFLFRRIPAGTYNDINGNANPARIIQECLTNKDWGLGIDSSYIDVTSFDVAAEKLYNEGFGLSCILDKQSILDFINDILRHIDGVLSFNPVTAKFYIKLIRPDDVDFSTLQTFDDSVIVGVRSIDRPTQTDAANNVILKYTNIETNRIASVNVQDIASISLNGKKTVELEFLSITNADIAVRVALRELKKLVNAPISISFEATQKAWPLNVGDFFRLTLKEYDIKDFVLMVAKISKSENENVIIDCIQPVFGVKVADITSDSSSWVNPEEMPGEITRKFYFEAPQAFVHLALDEASYRTLEDSDAFLAFTATCPHVTNQGYFLKVTAPTESEHGVFPEEGSFILGNDISKEVVSTLQITGSERFYVDVGDILVITDGSKHEFVVVDTYNVNDVIVKRGALDTVPDVFSAGSIVLKLGEFLYRYFVVGDVVEFKFLEVTALGKYDDSLAYTYSKTFIGRRLFPLPPGAIKINDSYYPAQVSFGDIAIGWRNRNRMTNVDIPPVVFGDENNYAPESGQVTRIVLIDVTGGEVTIFDYTAPEGNTYLVIPQTNLPGVGNTLKLKIWSEREGYQSFTTFEHEFVLV